MIRNLASASKVDLDREMKLRAELRAKVDATLKAAATDLDDTAADRPADFKAALSRVREESTGSLMSAAVPLYGYQKSWLQDKARFKPGMFARQCGKTFTTTLEVVDDCFVAMAEGRRERWVILSRGERQAKEAMDEGIKRHAQAYQIGLEALEYDWVGDAASYKALEVALPGGSRITALPANPDTARGFSANVFLDEFAFHNDSRAILKALFPVISDGWKLRVIWTQRQGQQVLRSDHAGGRRLVAPSGRYLSGDNRLAAARH